MNKQQLANKICTNLPSSEMRDEWLTNVTNAWIDDLNDARQSVHSKKKHSYSCQMISKRVRDATLFSIFQFFTFAARI